MSRKAFFDKTGFVMKNPYWAWCGVNHEKKLVMFTAFAHYKEKVDEKFRYLVFHDSWTKGKGYNDSKKKLDLVWNEGYKLCIYIAEPTKRIAMPIAKEKVKIKRIRSDFYFICDVVKENEKYWATPIHKVNV